MRAFKDFCYMVKKEVHNPKDLVDRQKMLLKGVPIKNPHQAYVTAQAINERNKKHQKAVADEDYSQIKSKIQMGRRSMSSAQDQRSNMNLF